MKRLVVLALLAVSAYGQCPLTYFTSSQIVNYNILNNNFLCLFTTKIGYQGTWSSSSTYGNMDLVISSGAAYISLQSNNLNNNPASSPLWWVVIPGSGGGGSMTWPSSAGIAVYGGSNAWGTSLTVPSSALVGISDTQSLTNKILDGVSPSTMAFLDATSSIQTQLNGKQSTITGAPGSWPAFGSLATANYPSSGIVKSTGIAFTPAVSGVDYAPASSGSVPLKGNGSGGFSNSLSSDIVNLFGACTTNQYLGWDGYCHTITGGSGVVNQTTGSGAPSANCTAPSNSNLATYADTSSNGDLWFCYATNSWKKILSTTGSGPYLVTGQTGTTPSTPSSGYVACYFDSTKNNQICLDSSGDAYTMVKDGVDLNANAGTVVNGSHITNSSIPNSGLVNTSMTVNGTTCTLGSSCSPSGGGGGTPNWVSGLVYYGGITGGTPWSYNIQNPATATAGTIYCVDAFDYPNLSPTEIIGYGGAASGSTYYQTIAVLNSAGTVEMYTTPIVMSSGGLAWEKWTIASGSIAGGQSNSYCTVTDSTATGPTWAGYGQYGTGGNWLNPGAAYGSGPINWYTCSTAKTGSGLSLTIPQYGNCPSGHGTRTAVPTSSQVPMALLMNQ